MPSYKLTYFPIQGLAEPIRFLLSYGEVDWVDDRFDIKDWPTLKPTTPFGQVPVLEIDGKKTHQSVAICRYLAKQFGLAGKNDWEALEIDKTVDTIHDLRSKIGSHHYESVPAAKEAKYGPVFNEAVPYILERLDAQVKDNGGYFHGGAITWADLTFVGLIHYMNYMANFDLTEKWANLKELETKVLEHPKIKAWIAKRPVTPN